MKMQAEPVSDNLHIERVESLPQFEHLFDETKEKNEKEPKIHFLRNILKMNVWAIILSTLVLIVQALPTIVIPYCSANIINIATEVVKGDYNGQYMQDILINLSIILFTIIINYPSTTLRWKLVSKMNRNISAGIRYSLVKKLQGISITYHKELLTGKVQTKFLNNLASIEGYLSTIMFNIIPNIIQGIIAVAVSIYKNGVVSLFFLFVIPLNILLSQLLRKKIRKAYGTLRVHNEEMGAKFTTMMEMIPVTKSHGLEQTELSSLNHSIKNVTNSGIKVDKINAKFGALMFITTNILSISCLTFCTFLALDGSIEIGDIVLYQTLFTTISGYISTIISAMPTLSDGNDAVKSISEIMNVTEMENAIKGVNSYNIKGDVEFKNVSYMYPKSAPYVIKNLNLSVKEGECIAVVGSSGSGKSTIMNMIIGFLTPTEGDVFIDGMNTKEMDLSEYRHNISVVPQNSILFAGTIKENITYGLSRYTEEDFNRAVEMANINEFVKDLPNGLNTYIGEHGDKLSGGQKQRITIARALIRNPKILILDEATSALDNISEYHVQKAIEQATRGRTTFIVAHRLSTIRNADRIVVMEEGSCVECGSFDELMAKKGKFYELKNLNDATSKKAEEALS